MSIGKNIAKYRKTKNLTQEELVRMLGVTNQAVSKWETKTKKYVFLISNALYVHAVYKLAELLSEDTCWAVVRDTSMISDYAFDK